MATDNRIFTLVAVGTLLFLGVAGFQAQYQSSVEESGQVQTVNDESFTPSGVVALAESNRDGVVYVEQSAINVTNDSGAIVFDAAGNYSWNRHNGTLNVTTGGQLDGKNSARITYGYTEAAQGQRVARDVALLPAQLGEILLIALAAALFVAVFVFLRRAG